MILALLIWIYTILVVGCFGWVICRALAALFRVPPSVSYLLQWGIGLLGWTTIGTLLSFWLPLGRWVAVGILIVGLLSVFAVFHWGRSEIKSLTNQLAVTPWILWVLAGGLLLTTLIHSVQPVLNDDTGLYHAQAIHWMEQYPVIPGLANLHKRFGYNSSWLLTQTLFSFSFLGGPSYHLMGSVLFLWVVLYFWRGLVRLWNGENCLSLWYRAFMIPVSFYFFGSQVSSPGTDLPSALWVWVLIAEWMGEEEAHSQNLSLRAILLILLSFYVVTIKLSDLPILILSLVLIGKALARQQKRILFTLGIAMIILFPWVGRFILLTGYPIYPLPSPALDLFPVNWKIPLQEVLKEKDLIGSWARTYQTTASPSNPLFSFTWVSGWWDHLSLNRRIILGLIGLLPLVSLLAGLLVRKVREVLVPIFTSYRWIWITLYVGCGYWFFSAPDFRFGSGLILSLFILWLVTGLSFLLNRVNWDRDIRTGLSVFLLAFQCFFFFQIGGARTILNNPIQPEEYIHSPTHPCDLEGILIMAPDDKFSGLCWYEPFPCTPKCPSSVKMRGESVLDGFSPAP